MVVSDEKSESLIHITCMHGRSRSKTKSFVVLSTQPTEAAKQGNGVSSYDGGGDSDAADDGSPPGSFLWLIFRSISYPLHLISYRLRRDRPN